MPLLHDIAIGASDEDPTRKIESVVRQVNEWGRQLSNERLTDVYNDNSSTPRIIIGVLPDGDTGIVISRDGIDVNTVFE